MDNAKHSVLVVDDEQLVLETTAFILRRLGCANVLTADSAAVALEQLDSAALPVHLILVDLNMPDIDGIELLRLISERGYEGDIVVFSSEDARTLSMAENLARARKLSVLGAISKPLKPDELAILLDRRGTAVHAPSHSMPELVTPERLEAAINAGELEPWYQPKVNLHSKQVVGVEALARWPDSSAGMIYPDAFIPVAEQHGLIDALTFLIIRKAAEKSAIWRAKGLNLKIAVNVSMDSLHDINFPDRIAEIFGAGQDLPPDTLLVEVTESRLMEDQVAPLDVLLRMHLKKIKLSIDDFGTGHSNLGQLRDLPFDELKLDRSYVQGAAKNPRSKTILESTVEMAKKLGMEIVAEGVETVEDWRRVESLGCNQAQGYLISRPLPGEDIPGWAADWKERALTLLD